MKRTILIISLIIIIGIEACDHPSEKVRNDFPENKNSVLLKADSFELMSSRVKGEITSKPCRAEQSLIDAGLTDVQSIDSTIIVDLKYSTCDNFLGLDVYGDLNRCYLQPDVAEKLKTCQKELRSRFPFYSLIIFDAVRPRSI